MRHPTSIAKSISLDKPKPSMYIPTKPPMVYMVGNPVLKEKMMKPSEIQYLADCLAKGMIVSWHDTCDNRYVEVVSMDHEFVYFNKRRTHCLFIATNERHTVEYEALLSHFRVTQIVPNPFPAAYDYITQADFRLLVLLDGIDAPPKGPRKTNDWIKILAKEFQIARSDCRIMLEKLRLDGLINDTYSKLTPFGQLVLNIRKDTANEP